MKLQMLAAVDLRWREVRDALVVMSIVVLIECDRTPGLPLVESHSPIGPGGSVLQGFELRFGIRVVVARAWSRMRLRDVEFRKVLRERPRCHRGSAICVNGYAAWIDIVFENYFPNQHRGERAGFGA